MAMTNFTEHQTDLTLNDVYAPLCSAEFSASIHNQLICLSVLNVFLSITAFLGNTLILVALHKVSSLHPPSKLLFRSLATTDLCVGFVVEPVHVACWISMVDERWDICRFTLAASFITASTLSGASLLTLTAISVDRLLALLLGLRYRQVVTLKRTRVTVIVLWVLCVFGSIIFLWNELIADLYILIFGNLSLVTSSYCYTRIFLRLRRHQTHVQENVQGQSNQTIPLNIAMYRKTVSSTLWLQFALIACYFPFVVVVPVVTKREHRGERISSFLFLAKASVGTFAFLNSSLNPILYYWKIREVRRAVKETIREFCSFS